jgi:hypothetical protein
METEPPIRIPPTIDTPEPIRVNARKLMLEPTQECSTTLKPLTPSLANDLTDIEEPMQVAPKSDTVEPVFTAPMTDIPEPMRVIARTEILEPMEPWHMTEAIEPNLAKARTETVEPHVT